MAYIKNEEYLPVAELLLISLQHDQAKIAEQYKGINQEFIQYFKSAIERVRTLESKYKITQEQKGKTVGLYALCNETSVQLQFLKTYAKDTGLDVKEIMETNTQLRKKNAEGAVSVGREMLAYMQAHKTELAKGDMPDGYLEKLAVAFDQIEMQNIEQNSFFNIRAAQAEINRQTYKDLYNQIIKIANAGKLVFKDSPQKKKEYTLRYILSGMRVK